MLSDVCGPPMAATALALDEDALGFSSAHSEVRVDDAFDNLAECLGHPNRRLGGRLDEQVPHARRECRALRHRYLA